MLLKIKNKNDNSVTTVSSILRIQNESKYISFNCSSENTIKISDSNVSYDSWYDTIINRKRVAIYDGGKIADIANFEKGINSYIQHTNSPYLLSFVGCTPDSKGNIQLLPGKTLDVFTTNNKIICSQLKIPKTQERSAVLKDVNRCIWYLYHTFNSFLYRMNIWNPNKTCSPMYKNARLLGVIQAYQAAVAAWNLKIWKSSFLWSISQVADSITFNVGYIALNCVNPNVSCVVTIKNTAPPHSESTPDTDEVSSESEDKDELDIDKLNSTEFYTIYDQGVATNIGGSVNRSIVKLVQDESEESTGEPISVNVSGKGTDTAAEEGKHWEKIVIRLNLGTLNQGLYYKGLFSLAIAQNATTVKHYLGADTTTRYKVMVNTRWILNEGSTQETIYDVDNNLTIPKLNLYSPDEELEDEEADYIQ